MCPAYDPKEAIRNAIIEDAEWRAFFTIHMTVGETPIENILFCAVAACCEIDGLHFHLLGGGGDKKYQAQKVTYEPQARVEKYRIDFVFRYEETAIAVECDGHDYHERTKEQAEHDRAKDRRLQELGFTIFRFTGSEIYRRPIECAKQILEAALG